MEGQTNGHLMNFMFPKLIGSVCEIKKLKKKNCVHLKFDGVKNK